MHLFRKSSNRASNFSQTRRNDGEGAKRFRCAHVFPHTHPSASTSRGKAPTPLLAPTGVSRDMGADEEEEEEEEKDAPDDAGSDGRDAAL